MTIDEVAKLIFIISVSIGILMVSFQLSRILANTANILHDFRKSIKNLGNFSEQVVEDYKVIGLAVKGLSGLMNSVNENVVDPIKKVCTLFGIFRKKETPPTTKENSSNTDI